MTKERPVADKIVLVRCTSESAGIDARAYVQRADKIVQQSFFHVCANVAATAMENIAVYAVFPREDRKPNE
jgi:hypothetical protein